MTKNWTQDEVDRLLEEMRSAHIKEDTSTTDDEDWVTLESEMPWWNNDNWNWATDRIAVGGDDYLFDQAIVAKMLEEGVTHVLDCREEAVRDGNFSGGFLAEIHKKMFVYLCNPTDDDMREKDANYFKKSIDFGLDALSNPNAKLYVHCAAGYNRGPSSAYAIMRAAGMSALEAENAIRSVRTVGLAYRDDADRAIRALGCEKDAR